MTDNREIVSFLVQSNLIEGISQPPTESQIAAAIEFLNLKQLDAVAVSRIVATFQPGAKLRTEYGMNVRVGNYIAPAGGPDIRAKLEKLLIQINSATINPFDAHIKYESLHPFTDGNGRSGRLIWLWQVYPKRLPPLQFLHAFYYQTLSRMCERHLND